MTRSWCPSSCLALLAIGVSGWCLTGCSPPVAQQEAAPAVESSPTAGRESSATTAESAAAVAEHLTPAEGAVTPAETPAEAVATAAAAGESAERGRQLYAQHCAACHGENGNGQGLAAKFLYPKPRDFRTGRFRLISTTNGVPTLDDLATVLHRGMPGSSMVSWAHLPEDDRRLLAETVVAFRREGAADLERQLAADADEELSDEDLAERVAAVTTPEEPFDPGELPPATADAVARGKELYLAKGCAACHGPTGRGDGQQQMIDSEGFATRPRDLTLGIYKGNHDRLAVFRRLWLGLPGSPMPASQNLTKEEVTAMVDFVLALSDEATRESWVLRRRELRAVRVAALSPEPGHSSWASVPTVEVQVTPLWWREGAASRVAVQAAHDGQQLALRITWADATPDERAVLPDEFEDLLAAQFYSGPAEPFLGMGAAGTPVDLWQWRAGYRAEGAEDQLSDEYPFDTPVYAELLGADKRPDFLTARVAGNPLAVREGTAGTLTAGGFGSTTFRPVPNQSVEALGQWQDGRWTVVLRRPLAVPADGGLSLSDGERCSVALAVWDGAARDRAGQKAISLWNDLIVE